MFEPCQEMSLRHPAAFIQKYHPVNAQESTRHVIPCAYMCMHVWMFLQKCVVGGFCAVCVWLVLTMWSLAVYLACQRIRDKASSETDNVTLFFDLIPEKNKQVLVVLVCVCVCERETVCVFSSITRELV